MLCVTIWLTLGSVLAYSSEAVAPTTCATQPSISISEPTRHGVQYETDNCPRRELSVGGTCWAVERLNAVS